MAKSELWHYCIKATNYDKKKVKRTNAFTTKLGFTNNVERTSTITFPEHSFLFQPKPSPLFCHIALFFTCEFWWLCVRLRFYINYVQMYKKTKTIYPWKIFLLNLYIILFAEVFEYTRQKNPSKIDKTQHIWKNMRISQPYVDQE